MTDWFGADDHVERAQELFRRGRWAEAEAELRKALALSPDRGEWQFNLGLTLEAAGRDAEAVSCYQRAADLMPDQAEPLVALGLVFNRVGQHDEAIDTLRHAIALDPESDLAHAGLVDSLACLDRHDEAETAFYLAQQDLEESPRCLVAIAESLMVRREWKRAGWCLREAIRLEPTLPRVRARLAAVLAATGRRERALQMYWRELMDDPGNVATLLDFGDLLLEMERLPEASDKYRRVLEIEPANVEAHARLGDLAMRGGRMDQAHVEFELVAKLDPSFPGIRLRLAEALVQRGRIGEARRWLVAELDAVAASDWAGDLMRLGDLLLSANEPERAAMVLDRAVRREKTAFGWRKLALARFRSGDRAGGMAASRQVLRIEPHCVAALHNLALAWLELGSTRRAAACVRRGLLIDPQDEGLRRIRSRLWLAQAMGVLDRISGVTPATAVATAADPSPR